MGNKFRHGPDSTRSTDGQPAHLQQGRSGEDTALAYLRAQGLKLVTRNFRCRFGEIDLIMRERDILVFVEVRCRLDKGYGSALESVDYRKCIRLQRTAQVYLQQHREDRSCRFDVIAISPTACPPGIEWVRNAFDAA
ncbi:YraN family protein [Plasticicumulans acidivorans]|uniref:YraN family protein n=1 Tax=Plasticicumulans acidivorans TaxID=886464 RepID=UPI00319DCD44